MNHAESAGEFAVEVERIMDTLERMPRDDPQFARMLTIAAVYLLGAHPAHRTSVSLDRVISQLDRTLKRLAPEDPMRLIGDSMYWAAVVGKAVTEHRPDLVKAAVTELTRCADRTPADSPVRPVALVGATSALMDCYVMTGELHLLKQAEIYWDKSSEALDQAALPGALDAIRGVLAYLRSIIDLSRIQHESGRQDLTETVANLEQVVDLMKPVGTLQPRVATFLEAMWALRGLQDPARGSTTAYVGRPERDAFDRILAEAQSIGRDHVDFPALAAQAATGLMLRGIADHDKSAMRQAISLLAEACSVPGLTFRERPRMLDVLGFALLTRYDLSRDPRDLSLAIDRLEEARRAVEQELGSPYAANVLQSLASAYRIRGDAARGDVDRAVRVGLDALRERAGDVLLQDGDENALRAARRVTSDAGQMARWFLSRGRPAAAIEALEFGRGTVLHAATSGARLAEALEDAGRTDLAGEWAHHMSGGEGADDLRYRIMIAIEGSAVEARLLAPPSLSDIKAALAASNADALVYLLPRGEDGAGLAVLVDSGGHVEALPLPGLHTGRGSPVDSVPAGAAGGRVAADSRDTDPGRYASAEENWRAALSELCDWTWRVGLGPVLAATPARSGGSRRIVLVPGGELGLVAWHAAAPVALGGFRYATQEAVFSTRPRRGSSSARPGGGPVRGRRHPSSSPTRPVRCRRRRRGSGTSTPPSTPRPRSSGTPVRRLDAAAGAGLDAATEGDVLAALPHEDHPGASVLHFGCHGRAQVPVLGSHLDLGAGNTVASADVLRGARRRAGPVSGGASSCSRPA